MLVIPPRDDRTWIQTFTGRQFWPLNPDPADVSIFDIAHALSMTCRYAGHTNRFFSVAQHSVMVSRIVPLADALWGLLHDAPEAYSTDIVRPIKRHIAVLGFAEIEARLEAAIAAAFGLTLPIPASVHEADMIALATERRDLMAPPPRPWISTEHVQPLPYPINPLNPHEAEQEFLKRFAELTGSSTT